MRGGFVHFFFFFFMFLIAAASCTPFDTGSNTNPPSVDGGGPSSSADAGGDSSPSPGPKDSGLEGGAFGVIDPSCSPTLVTGSQVVSLIAPNQIKPGGADGYGFRSGSAIANVAAHCVWIYVAEGNGNDLAIGIYDGTSAPLNRRGRALFTDVRPGWNASPIEGADYVVVPNTTVWLVVAPISGAISIAPHTVCPSPSELPVRWMDVSPAGNLPSPWVTGGSDPNLCAPALFLSRAQ